MINNTQTIANQLITLCSKSLFVEALTELFDTDATSIDPLNPDRGTVKGVENILAAEKQFLSRTTIHEVAISEPIVSGKYFTVRIFMDFTINNARTKVDELGVYEVKDDKIISQQFFIGSVERQPS